VPSGAGTRAPASLESFGPTCSASSQRQDRLLVHPRLRRLQALPPGTRTFVNGLNSCTCHFDDVHLRSPSCDQTSAGSARSAPFTRTRSYRVGPVPLREDFPGHPVGDPVPGWLRGVPPLGVGGCRGGLLAGDTVVIFGAGGVGSTSVPMAPGSRPPRSHSWWTRWSFEARICQPRLGATPPFATANEAHEFVVETTWPARRPRDHGTAGAVTVQEMVNSAVGDDGKWRQR